MEALQGSEYNEAWYQNRALASLKKIDEGIWDYSDSLLLYVPGGDNEYEAAQRPDNAYAKLITEPERAYLADIAPKIAEELPGEFEFIDLGPGTAHKEQYLFDECAKLGKKFVYKPVDISKHYLKMAEEYASAQHIQVEPILSAFEDLSSRLEPSIIPRFVSLGLTYINFAPAEILNLLKDIAGSNGKIFINAQIRERADMAAITDAYSADAASGMLDAKLKVLGINPQTDVSEILCDDAVKTWVSLQIVPPELATMGVKPGDKLLTFQSLRPSLEELEEAVSQASAKYKLLDTGHGFVGAVLG